jgi:hypothetical protein
MPRSPHASTDPDGCGDAPLLDAPALAALPPAVWSQLDRGAIGRAMSDDGSVVVAGDDGLTSAVWQLLQIVPQPVWATLLVILAGDVRHTHAFYALYALIRQLSTVVHQARTLHPSVLAGGPSARCHLRGPRMPSRALGDVELSSVNGSAVDMAMADHTPEHSHVVHAPFELLPLEGLTSVMLNASLWQRRLVRELVCMCA